jgi:hypothetical protein
VNAFVSGGFLPTAMRGTVITGLVAGWDWYATWAHLAGVDDITDHRAAKANLPVVNSINMWPLLSGSTKASPRTQVAIGSNLGGDAASSSVSLAPCSWCCLPVTAFAGQQPIISRSQRA